MTPPHVVVAATRRAWSAEKRAILAEAREATTSISAVARRHGVHASLLCDGAATLGMGRMHRAPSLGPAFVPLALPAPASNPAPAVASGAIEIEVAGGHRVRVERGADPALLRSVIAALVGR